MLKGARRAVAPAILSLIPITGLFGTAAAASAASAATLTYTAQTRTVSASAYTGTPQSASAPDFGAFDAAVTSTGTGINVATATQRSQLLATQVTFSSTASGTRTSNSPADNIQGRAVLDTTFTLDAASPYEFDILFTAPNNFRGYCLATLTDQATNSQVFTSVLPGPALTPDWSPYRTGTLAAGSYRLVITHDNGTSTGTLSFGSGFSAAFTVPEPAAAGLLVAGVGLLGRRRSARRANLRG